MFIVFNVRSRLLSKQLTAYVVTTSNYLSYTSDYVDPDLEVSSS